MTDEISRLKDVEPLEVSLVPKGANQRDFLILKNKEGNNLMAEQKNKVKKDLDKREVGAMLADIWDITTGEALAFMEALDPTEPQDRRAIATVVAREYEGLSPVDVMEVLADAEDNPDHYDDEEVRMEDIAKSDLPDDVINKVETIFKQNQEIKEENEQIKKSLHQAREEQRKKEFVAKAEQFQNLAVDSEEFGEVLKTVADSSEEAFDKVMNVLKSADNILKQNDLFNERGSSLEGQSGGAWGKIEKTAQSLMEQDSSLSKEKAINKALKDNPDLYKEYMKEGK